jgi:hypothetical protein
MSNTQWGHTLATTGTFTFTNMWLGSGFIHGTGISFKFPNHKRVIYYDKTRAYLTVLGDDVMVEEISLGNMDKYMRIFSIQKKEVENVEEFIRELKGRNI